MVFIKDKKYRLVELNGDWVRLETVGIRERCLYEIKCACMNAEQWMS